MIYLNRYRIVKLSSELQGEFNVPQLICADPDSMPFPEGQAFYRWVIDDNACEPITAYNYLNAILPFFTFLWFRTPSSCYTAPAEQIRNCVRDYVREKLGCAVRPHHNGNFVVKASSKTITAASVRLFLTALKRFYMCAILKGWYSDSNPMVWASQLAVRDREFEPKMPPQSGMRLQDSNKRRLPDTYFCVVSGEWQPRIIDDGNLPKLLLTNFSQLRDHLIARILFESGARIGEVLGITLGDWRSCKQGERALAINKGSGGERVKEIWWSSASTVLLYKYLKNERRLCDKERREFNDLPDFSPLFVTDEGDPYTYDAFYVHWRNACRKADLKLTPHQARHWFVTVALHRFESLPEEKRESARQSLIAYMGWRNPVTIKAYDHHICKLNFAPIHEEITRLVEQGNDDRVITQSLEGVALSNVNATSLEMREWLSRILDHE